LGLGNKADLAEVGRAKIAESNANRHSVINDKAALPKHDTRKEIAKAAGVSTGRVGRVKSLTDFVPSTDCTVSI
jgi:hypothetical protein